MTPPSPTEPRQGVTRMRQLVWAGLELKAARWGLTPAERLAHERLALLLHGFTGTNPAVEIFNAVNVDINDGVRYIHNQRQGE